MSDSPAFEILRRVKNCDDYTEELVMKKVRSKVTQDELLTCFERGISGEYGKFVVADPQTLINWVTSFLKSKESPANYLETGLLNPSLHITAHAYPTTPTDWCKEANKCFTAFLNGISESYFHPHVYDRMMLDNKINLDECKKYFKGVDGEENVTQAKQKVLRDVFSEYKAKGWNTVYFL